MSKEFYCAKCEESVIAEEDYLTEDKGGMAGDCKKAVFCPMCGSQLGNEMDADAVYDYWRDEQMFEKEKKND